MHYNDENISVDNGIFQRRLYTREVIKQKQKKTMLHVQGAKTMQRQRCTSS
jgi:hypothetical protein